MADESIFKVATELLGKSDVKTNSNWDAVPTDWFCPCCKRSKVHLLRVSKADNLVGNLVNHHDHIRKYAEISARDQVRELHNRNLNEREGWFLNQKIIPFLNRFERTLVCDDCNNADPLAKNMLGNMCEYLSFSPEDIARFIEPEPCLPHRINFERVKEVYASVLSIHEYRKSLCVTLVSRLISYQRHWGDHTQHPEIKHFRAAKRLANSPVMLEDSILLSINALTSSQRIDFSKALEGIEKSKHRKSARSASEKEERRNAKIKRREARRSKAINENLHNHGEPWTIDHISILESDYVRGMTLAELSVKNGRTAGSIRARLRKSGYVV